MKPLAEPRGWARLHRWLVLRLYYGHRWHRCGWLWRWADRERDRMIERRVSGYKAPR